MKKWRRSFRQHQRQIGLVAAIIIVLGGLLTYHLGSLPGGVSGGEVVTANLALGWHGLYHQPLYLPLNVVRSVVFFIFGHHGQLLTRLPNVVFGALTMAAFVWLIRLWHGGRTMLLAGALFVTSAWVLHASRLASYDVLYLWALPTLLLIQAALQRRPHSTLVNYGAVMVWGMMLYIPGLVWLLLLSLFWQRAMVVAAWRHFRRWWQRSLYALAGVIWLPLLGVALTRHGVWRTWLGLPAHLAVPLQLLKQFGQVFGHLFVRGPHTPQIWLVGAPIMDIFTSVVCLIGIYFYVRHWRASRSRIIGSYVLVGAVLVALGGPVGLSLLVPFLYIVAATGVTYLLHEWLQVFPVNPLARGLGTAFIVAAVSLSCLYNLRAYFVAWPHNSATQATFTQHLLY